MTGRFVEVVCSFDQVVPEIGRQKNISPIMVRYAKYIWYVRPYLDQESAWHIMLGHSPIFVTNPVISTQDMQMAEIGRNLAWLTFLA